MIDLSVATADGHDDGHQTGVRVRRELDDLNSLAFAVDFSRSLLLCCVEYGDSVAWIVSQ